MKQKQCGKIAIFGRPNSGKSTLLNALVDAPLSSISPRPQTTQRVITGIYSRPDTQFIFLDSPGFLRAQDEVQELIHRECIRAIRTADVGIWVHDLTREKGEEDEEIQRIQDKYFTFPIIHISTKSLERHIRTRDGIHQIDPKKDTDLSRLLDIIEPFLPERDFEFTPESYTSLSFDERIQEVLRGSLFKYLGQEIPYDCHISVEDVEDGNMLRILVIITTNTLSQKTIVIGSQGKSLQNIGKDARLLLEKIYDKKVFLGLRVRAQKGWKQDERMLKTYFS